MHWGIFNITWSETHSALFEEAMLGRREKHNKRSIKQQPADTTSRNCRNKANQTSNTVFVNKIATYEAKTSGERPQWPVRRLLERSLKPCRHGRGIRKTEKHWSTYNHLNVISGTAYTQQIMPALTKLSKTG